MGEGGYSSADVDGSDLLSLNNDASNAKNVTDLVQLDVSEALKNIPGNDVCAECYSPEPDWASLNLGILLCIECSGVHRNLGVHISKVQFLHSLPDI